MLYYLPIYNNLNCANLRNGDVIRVYERKPTTNSDVDYIDYYINNHYVNISGTQHFATTSTIPSCIDSSNITDNVFYRFDIGQILLIFIILVIVCFYFPYKMFIRMFGRWLKC